MPLSHSHSSQEHVKSFKENIEAERKMPYSEDQKEVLRKTRDILKNYSEEMVSQWNKEIDGLLTFVSGFDILIG